MEKHAYRTGSREDLIAALTDDLTPVVRVKPVQGATFVGLATLIAGVASIAYFGFWTGMVSGEASGYFWIANGLLTVLGAASTAALVASALPRVGSRAESTVWAAAMIGVLPVAGLLSLLSTVTSRRAGPVMWYWECSAYGLVAGLLVAGAAVHFLRRGAPVSLERAGWLTGIAAGSLGSLAYGITCPLDTVTHVGIVHIAPVAIGAILGRIAVPPLIRW
ncbi:NrsF family protein [Erythrobacter sp. JK5]|uniref:NrsF family protein n=1 Tax=Erythrobacter sp. JK5 TaxID=2829500 RepID=UPI001BA489E5|nr:DUF1109 domain-containing protein [Erythrobacter sp. JK5]QUL37767.1 DUF1109 domain-containing protein [Erythrobacter sp. JK5]